MANVYVQKRGKYYQYQFQIASVDGKRKYINNLIRIYSHFLEIFLFLQQNFLKIQCLQLLHKEMLYIRTKLLDMS